MHLYETNFMLLMRLIPSVQSVTPHAVSRVSEGEDLYIQVLEKTKYTCRILLTHQFNVDQKKAESLPGLTIRLFFDTGQAEVIAWQGEGSFADINKANFSQLPSVKAKWQVNLFLGKWLQYCLQIGHRFDQRKRRPPSIDDSNLEPVSELS